MDHDQQEKPHVVFGTGPLGMAVMRELLRQGKTVRMVNTRGEAGVPPGVEVLKGDGYSAASTTALAKGAEVVYQCAMPPYHQWRNKFPALQSSIMEGAARNGAKLVIGDNLYMYGRVSGPIRENLPYAARTRKGRLRAEMAEAALAAHAAGKARVAIGRGSDFFGPGVLASAIGQQAVGPILKGEPARLLGRVDVPHTFTYIEDFGRALVLLGERDEALGQAWHVPNDRPLITQRELMELFFAEVGRPPRAANLRKWAMALLCPFVPVFREMLEMMYALEEPYVVDSSKFEKAFGGKATPINDAVRDTIAWYREHWSGANPKKPPIKVRAGRRP